MLVDHMHSCADEAELENRAIGPDEARVRGPACRRECWATPGLRLDDASDEVVKRRLEVYAAESAALLQHYPATRITHVNAVQPPHVVLRDILTVLIGSPKLPALAA